MLSFKVTIKNASAQWILNQGEKFKWWADDGTYLGDEMFTVLSRVDDHCGTCLCVVRGTSEILEFLWVAKICGQSGWLLSGTKIFPEKPYLGNSNKEFNYQEWNETFEPMKKARELAIPKLKEHQLGNLMEKIHEKMEKLEALKTEIEALKEEYIAVGGTLFF